jgi:Uma2 family endonuclease
MVAAAKKKTFDELYAVIRDLPEGRRGEILMAGELYVTMGRPGRKHRRAAQVLHHALAPRDANLGGTGWWIEVEPEVRFGERLFDPDLAGWRVERVPELPEENPIGIVPDWCCEVLSPSTAADDVKIKLPGYIAAGVPHVWIIDPVAHWVQVFGAAQGKPVLLTTVSDEAAASLPPFDLAIDVRRLWTSAKPG